MKKMNNLITEREIFLKNSAEKRRSARQQSHLDLADLEGLPMPAVADMRAVSYTHLRAHETAS